MGAKKSGDRIPRSINKFDSHVTFHQASQSVILSETGFFAGEEACDVEGPYFRRYNHYPEREFSPASF
jgi:hypothetical protein